MVVKVRRYKRCDFNQVNKILNESFDVSKVDKRSRNIELVACLSDKVVGYLVVNKLYDSVRSINYFHINYVCVDSNYRKLGIATKLLEEVFRLAKTKKISYIELTSNKKRTIAHKLYLNNGFTIRDTNVFRKEII